MGPFKSNLNCEQTFLDGGQYQKNGILRYEKVFGETFVSTGGLITTQEFVGSLDLKPGMKVLDIGCGTGGSAFFMAREYGVQVLGLDLSQNMLDIANQHKSSMESNVQNSVSFRYLDATLASFPENHFDVVYSRDAIMHIADKPLLYNKVFTWLKPGGKLLVSEYVHGKNHPNHTQEYIDYIDDRGYQLLTVTAYATMLTKAGFSKVEGVDLTQKFIQVLKDEMLRFTPTKESFVKEFSLQDFNDLVEGWDIKVVRCEAGEQGWALFKATKAADTL